MALLETGNDPQQGRFARAALAENGEEFAFGDFQRNISQNDILAKTLGHVANLEQSSERSCRELRLFGRVVRWSVSAVKTSHGGHH